MRTRRRVQVAMVATLTLAGTGALGASPGAAAGAASGAAAGAPACPLPAYGPGATYHPRLDRRGFTAHVTNRLFPLRPGRVLVYAGRKDGRQALDLVLATGRVRRVDGVPTRVVEDRLYLDGVLAERTADYYSQDRCGNVWYFGEDTASLDRHGRVVDTEGSWLAGVNGAEPGVFMQARPQLERRFRQEWYAGQAEDTFRAVRRSVPVTVPAGHFEHALETRERTALEPGVLDRKLYVAGVGQVLESSLRGPVEHLELVEVIG
ncbi:MAG TPA: hypothetical protein VFJ97_00295 [Dermatophilaceae bacterium]|nr:hypothetical protein [Dermatophilaceae bacterium]